VTLIVHPAEWKATRVKEFIEDALPGVSVFVQARHAGRK
jgi:hypothetical protein